MSKIDTTICTMFAASLTGACWGLGFTHPMPKATNEQPTNPAYAEMAADFANPFGKVTTGCYWYWIGGNVSSDGVRKDLQAMKKAGIERAYIGDISGSGNAAGPVKTFSKEWHDALQMAFRTAREEGVEIGLFNSPGWSQSGGPWVKSTQAMRRWVMSSTVVTGPCTGVKLPTPKFESAPANEFQDVAAVAFPLPPGFTDRLEKKDVNNSLLQVSGKPLVFELTSEQPFTAQGSEFNFVDGSIAGVIEIHAWQNNAWRLICSLPFSRVNHSTNVGFSPHAPITTSFAPETAKRFRVTIRPHGRYQSRFSSVALVGAPMLARAYEKSLAKMYETPLPMWNEYQWPDDAEAAPGTALDRAKAVVLASKVAADGTLDWQVPAGKWVIYRFAMAPTGTKNGPANPEATGYEVDKMSGPLVGHHFDSYLKKLIERTPAENRGAIRHAVLDSYEMGGQNATDDFAARFQASFGYDPRPFLPSVFGFTTDSKSSSNRFLWDLRRFVADEVAYSYVAGLRKASNAYGLGTWLECYGHWGFPGEFLQYGGQSDGIGGEYWCEGSLGDIENRAASSCGHTYGKRVIWAESNTCGGRPYARGPMDLKLRTDRFFADGINASILHLYIHQCDDRAPGMIAWFGNEFNRKNSWFPHFDLFTGYLKRTGYLLQQGLNVADVAYFIGEDAPKMTGITDPGVPSGRQFDYINGEVLRETVDVDARGRLVLPHGTAYEVLVLPKLETMRPELLARIEALVMKGAFVMGPKPKRSPSLQGQPAADQRVAEIANRLWGDVDGKTVKYAQRGKGTIAWGLSMDEAFALRKSVVDFDHDRQHALVYSHRTMPNAEVYFVANISGRAVPAKDLSFRVTGCVPEIWLPATGERREAASWRVANGRTVVTRGFAQNESFFVVFAQDAQGRTASVAQPAAQNVAVTGPWQVTFQSDALHRGPQGPVTFANLIDLSKSSDPAIRHYSGMMTYRTTFNWNGTAGARATLDLGEVAVTAKVTLNGQKIGGVCFAPYQLDVTQAIKPGANELAIEVCDLWINRLVGDAEVKDRPTWTSMPTCGKGTPLVKAGLIGPVNLQVGAR